MALFLPWFVPAPVLSDHGLDQLKLYHFKDQHVVFRLHAPTLNADQRTAITNAAKAWETDIGKSQGGLDFTKSTITSGDPFVLWKDEANSNRLLWEEDVCPTTWDCAEFDSNRGISAHTHLQQIGGHIQDVDTMFRKQIAWRFNDTECKADDPDGPYGAPGDFGPFFGDKNRNGVWEAIEAESAGDRDDEADQFTIAFHEFVHWQYLDDWSYPPDFVTENNTKVAPNANWRECWSADGHGRTAQAPSAHDEATIYKLYDLSNSHGHVGH